MIVTVIIAGAATGCSQNSSPTPPQSQPPPVAQSAPQTMPQAEPARTPSLALVQLDQRDFTMEAIQGYKKRVEENAKDAEALEALGNGNFMIQRMEKAKEYYEQSLAAEPKRATARLSLSNVLVFLRQPDDAIGQLDILLKDHKDNPEGLFNLGLIRLYSKQDSAGAKGAWDRLISVHPNHELAGEAKRQLDGL